MFLTKYPISKFQASFRDLFSTMKSFNLKKNRRFLNYLTPVWPKLPRSIKMKISKANKQLNQLRKKVIRHFKASVVFIIFRVFKPAITTYTHLSHQLLLQTWVMHLHYINHTNADYDCYNLIRFVITRNAMNC